MSTIVVGTVKATTLEETTSASTVTTAALMHPWEFIDSYTAVADAEIIVSADGFDSVSPVSFLDGYTYKVEFDGHGSVDNGLLQFELFENGSYRTGVSYYRNQNLRL